MPPTAPVPDHYVTDAPAVTNPTCGFVASVAVGNPNPITTTDPTISTFRVGITNAVNPSGSSGLIV